MADTEHVSSTTHFEEEELDSLHNNGVMGDLNEALAEDVVNDDEIVDLVGGAQDAIERHKSTWSQPEDLPQEVSEKFSAEEPEQVLFSEPETEPEPLLAPPTKVEEDATEQPTKEVIPDSTTVVEEPEEKVIAPEAEPEHTLIVPEPVEEIPEVPQAEPVSVIPEPIPEPVAIAPPPAPVEEVLPKAPVKEAPVPSAPAPASCELLPPTAAPHPLMQFPTALGQKGDSPAPISPLSPLNSPDSLEELSLSESPNQPPASAATFWPSSKPPEALTKDMPWDGEEGNFRPGHGNRDVEETVDGLTSPYLCLGKESRPLCEDSGVSTSPEEKLFSSDRSAGLSQSPTQFQTKVLESHTAPASNPTDHWDTPFLASQDNSRVSMDTFSKNTAPIGSSEYQPDMLGNQSDDDLMFAIKKNPFQGFSPVADAAYSHFGESKADRSANKMSESPTPDLVQYGQTGDSQESPPSFYDEDKTYESVKMAADSLMQPLHQISSSTKEGDSVLPPSLPDILKSSPLNPEKLDSGSSEGSPEEQSPILERKMMESPNPPINLSVNNPFALDSKISLLKEMAEETELKLKSGDKIKVKDDDEKCFGAFDLVKEAEESTPPQLKEDKPFQIEHKDWFSSYDSPKSSTKFEPLDLQHKKTCAEESDSESPSADSLSPVLEAMAKNPSIFQVEQKKAKMDTEEAEAAEEASEPEVSSEEFEFIERPPRGVIDEFLEALDNSKFASNAPELSRDNKMSFGMNEKLALTKAVQPEEEEDEEEETPNQSSYLLLSQPSEKASPQKSKANLEKADIRDPPSQAPLTHSPVRKAAEAVAKKETWGSSWMPNLNIKSVVDLLYWRDVKTTGVVFGAALLLLLSLSVCSIVSVCSYVGLALLSVTIAFRIYKGILQAIQKSDEGHPFKLYLDQEVALSEDVVHKYSDAALAKINQTIATLRRVFLVEDLVDSLKFAVLMWVLTYVGALFNGLTILILGLVGAFSCPIIYEKHQVQIDHYVGMVNSQIKDAVGKIQAKVPGLKRKAE